jgi:transposase
MVEITLPLDIPDIEIVNIEINIKKGIIIITLKSTVEGTRCHICGRKINKPHSHDREIKLRHLSILGMETYILIRPARYQCIHCKGKPTTTQKLQWYNQRSSCTIAFEEHILLQLVHSTVEDVSIKENIGYDAVMGIIDRYIGKNVNWKEINSLDILGIDEISLKKGHKDFVTIVTERNGDGKIRILAVISGRKKEDVKKFLSSIPKRLRKTILAVCSDLYKGYINAIKEVFGDDLIIIADRFHIAKLYRKGLEGLRKKEMKRLKKGLSEDEYKKLNGVMWILRKNINELTEEEFKVLRLLFKYSPILKIAHKFCNELTNIFEDDISKSEAKRRINEWKNQVIKSGLTCFNKFISTLDEWMEEITNYFINRQTSGFVEGFNNKIKVIKRRCYGIFNITHLFQRIHLDLVGYSLFD